MGSVGRHVKVPRLRGQLFVRAMGCCGGRTEDGRPAVPTDVYHAEWERRGLRDVVHLTAGASAPALSSPSSP